MAKAKTPAASGELPDPEHELNPDVYRAPETVVDEPAVEETVVDAPTVEEPADIAEAPEAAGVSDGA